MDIKQILSDTNLKLKKEEIASIVGVNEQSFKVLADLAFSREMPICWRATWLMDYLAELEPSLAEGYLAQFWEELFRDHQVGVSRSLIRLLSRNEIPEHYHGKATDLCLEWLEKVSVPVALKVYAMEVLLKIARLYPELVNEFIMIIEEQIPYNSVGYKSRSKHIIKAMRSINIYRKEP